MLACPGVTRGEARVELYEARKSSVVAAHESDLARLALSGDGSLLARTPAHSTKTVPEKSRLMTLPSTRAAAAGRCGRSLPENLLGSALHASWKSQ